MELLVVLVVELHITLLVGLEQQHKDLRVETIQEHLLTVVVVVVAQVQLAQMLDLMLPMELMVALELAHQLMVHPQQEVVVAEAEWDKADLCNHLVALEGAQMGAHHLVQAEAMLLQILVVVVAAEEETLAPEEMAEKVL